MLLLRRANITYIPPPALRVPFSRMNVINPAVFRMPKFVLIDPSLERLGGHHYDYACHTLRAADELGFETFAATNRKFPDSDGFPPNCRCQAIFQHHAYSRYSDLWGIHRLLLDQVPPDRTPAVGASGSVRGHWFNWNSALNHLQRQHGRQKRIRRFSRTCEKLFAKVPLATGDHVFLPSNSELELYGLAKFLGGCDAARNATWHVQFHFNLFDGQLHKQFEQDEQIQVMRRHFEAVLRSVQGSRILFYSTTDSLARQYNRLEVADFDSLAYPVNPAFHAEHTGPPTAGPWRVLCAGEPRKEKGFAYLPEILQPLSRTRVDGRQVKLLAQMQVADGAPRKQRSDLGPSAETPKFSDVFEQVKYPLTNEEYSELIRSAHVGLFLYDSQSYFTRRAGVLGETLAAGVPVVVPAGCWLAEQIAEPTFSYLEQLAQDLTVVRSNDLGNFEFAAQSTAVRREFDLSEEARILLTQFHWTRPPRAETFVRLRFRQLSAAGTIVHAEEMIVGNRADGRKAITAVRRHPDCHRVQIEWSNAYGDAPIHVEDCRFEILTHDAALEGKVPLGSVGLASADPTQTDSVVQELLAHYGHYRATAKAFSLDWFRRHDPQSTIQELAERSTDATCGPCSDQAPGHGAVGAGAIANDRIRRRDTGHFVGTDVAPCLLPTHDAAPSGSAHS